MTDFQRPRPYTDASLRRHHYGPIEPMHDTEFHWEHGAITAVVMFTIALGIWGLI